MWMSHVIHRCVRKRALHFSKRALHFRKRALHVRKRALHFRKRALHVRKRALLVRKRALHVRKRALHVRSAQEWRNRTLAVHERDGCWIVSVVMVLSVHQTRLYLHCWYNLISLLQAHAGLQYEKCLQNCTNGIYYCTSLAFVKRTFMFYCTFVWPHCDFRILGRIGMSHMNYVNTYESVMSLVNPSYDKQRMTCSFTQKSPIYTRKSPTYTQKSPTYTQKSPIHTQKSPMYIQKTLITLKRALITLKKPLITLKQALERALYITNSYTQQYWVLLSSLCISA